MIQNHIKVVAEAWVNDEATIYIGRVVVEPVGERFLPKSINQRRDA